MTKQTETDLFAVVTNGKSRTAMPRFAERLSPRDRALLVRYVRYFADPVARERLEVGFLR